MKLGSERDGKVVCVIIIISCDPTRLNSLFSLHGVHILVLSSSFSSYFYQRERFTFSFFMFFVILLLHGGYKYVYYMMRQLDCNRTARKKKDHDSWDHSEKISGLMIMPASERDGEKTLCNAM